MTDLEQQLNALSVELRGESDRVDAEPLIDRCFEIGFFPWDNPKFLVFLYWAIEAKLLYRNQFLRGTIYARHVEAIMPPDADPDLYRNICAWANLEPTENISGVYSPYPHPADLKLFWLRFWRQAQQQADLPLELDLKLAKLQMRRAERKRRQQ